MIAPQFQQGLRELINRHGLENGSDTPDFMLADYLVACLEAFNAALQKREQWWGRKPLDPTDGEPKP